MWSGRVGQHECNWYMSIDRADDLSSMLNPLAEKLLDIGATI